MSRSLLRAFLLLGLTAGASTAAANAPPPVIPPPVEARVPVDVTWKDFGGPKEAIAKLIIPRGMKLEGLRLEEGERDGLSGAAVRTIGAGFALSLGAIALLFVARARRGGKIVAGAAVLVAGIVGGWSAARANMGLPPNPRRSWNSFPPHEEGAALLIIEVQSSDVKHATLLIKPEESPYGKLHILPYDPLNDRSLDSKPSNDKSP